MSEILDPRAPVRIRHETRLRLLTVTAVTDITPRMRRITLLGDLEGFVSPSYCDHIKAFIFPAGVDPYVAPIGERGAEFPPEDKPQMRDYTPRFWDIAAGKLELDFVLHGDGPASGWAAQAAIGQTLVIGGPRGSFMVPQDFDWYLLAGDETALPAMGRRIEELPAGTKVLAFIEVADASEEQVFETAADLELHYLHRHEVPAGHGSLILDAIRQAALPQGTAYAHILGESQMSKAVRAHLTEERGFNPEYVKSAGYWKLDEAGH